LIVFLAATSAIASFVMTWVVRRQMLHNGFLDYPNERSSHTSPTPRGGGIAVLFAVALAIGIAALVSEIDTHLVSVLGCGGFLLAAIGFWDDRRGVPVQVRLAVHFIVAIGTMWALGGLPELQLGTSSWVLGRFGYLLGTLGIVWAINLFNFMDGIDGLVTSQSVILYGAAAVLLLRNDMPLANMAALIAAASAGFLFWNWPPANIFLGDVGSGPLGYFAAGLAISSENRHSMPLIGFATIAGVLIVDATVTLLRRSLRGVRLSVAHREHAYQRLTRSWGSHRHVTLAAAALTLVLAALGGIGSIEPRLRLPMFLTAYFLLGCALVLIERRAPM